MDDNKQPVDPADVRDGEDLHNAVEQLKLRLRGAAARRRNDSQISGAFSDIANLVDEAQRGLADLRRYMGHV